MRISTNQLYDQNIRGIMENQSGLANVQEQLSSGKKLNRPSDDPVGAAEVIRLTEELDKITQYQRNNDLVTGSLEQQEAVLSNVTNSANRARVLVLQAGSGINSDADRQALAEEIAQIRDEVLDLMNSKTSNGDYMFAGYQSELEPFVFNQGATGDQVSFQGDNGTRNVKLSDSVSVRSNASGLDVFENVEARKNFTVTGSTGMTVNDAYVSDQSSFDRFHDDGNTSSTYELEILPSGQMQISDIISPGVTNVLATVDFTSGTPFTYRGIEFDVEGSVGDTMQFQFDATEKDNLAQTLHSAFVALSNDDLTEEELRETLNDALVGIDNSMASVSKEVSSIGARLNVAESVYETNLDLEIAAKDARSSIEDVDYAEASAEFAKQETALSAALTTFPKLANLSLFDYIG